MDEITTLIKLINSDELYDAKDLLDKVTEDKISDRKEEIAINLDIFNKK